ncbi:MAG TPA: hypothetical protein VH704_15875 [Casimicrobiaceae bacterium]|nr:hypothetical protein [Casimicrobiaceae bacterium]
MSENFDARGDPGWTSPGQISVPQQTWDQTSLRDARYVRLTRSDNQASNVFKVTPREAATGRVVWLSPGQLGLAANEVHAVTIDTADKNAYQWMQLVGTGWGKLTLLGLALGLVGIGIDAAFDIGKYKLLFPTSDALAAWARVVAYILKAVGLLIVFLQATWFKKD